VGDDKFSAQSARGRICGALDNGFAGRDGLDFRGIDGIYRFAVGAEAESIRSYGEHRADRGHEIARRDECG